MKVISESMVIAYLESIRDQASLAKDLTEINYRALGMSSLKHDIDRATNFLKDIDRKIESIKRSSFCAKEIA